MGKRILSFVSALTLMITVLAMSASMAIAATALKITKQPASVIAAPSGTTAKVSVTAKGDSLKYTWYYKNSGSSKYSKDSKNKAKTYSVKMSSKINGRKVYCVVKDKSGKTVKTSVATLKMGNPAKITAQPENAVAEKNKTAKVTVKATGDSIKYYWYVKDKGASKFTRDTKNTSKTYSVKMTSKINGRKVYCIVKDKYGSKVQTDTVTLYMGNAAKITAQPVNAVVAKNKTAKVTVKATGDSLKYTWYYKNKGASKYTKDTSATKSTYSVKMTSKIDGRKVYCVVKDKYGTSVKSSVVTLVMGNAAKITTQPSSVKVNCGSTAKTTVKATGDSLKYIWYYKNPGSTKFSKDSANTSKTYSVKMTAKTNGRQVYCVVKDKYGTSVQSKTVTLTGIHVYDKGVITKAATCTKDGVKTFTCNCSATRTEAVAKLGHNMGDWKVMVEATVTSEGYKRSSCTRSGCTYYKDERLAKLPVKWNITVDTGVGDSYKVGVAENGKYSLEAPVKVGYNFAGWKTENGADFAASGLISGDITVVAQWTLDGTDTFAELKERTEALVEEILITGDITVTEPLFITAKATKLYSDGNYTIKRADNYAGDILVVGRESSGRSATEAGRQAILNLGGGKGVLTIDGNRDNMKEGVTVVGSLVLASDSAIVNIYDGVKLANNNKTGNDRVQLHNDLYGTESYKKVGGAAIASIHASINMYGGVIENNAVATEYTVIFDEETQKDISYEYNGCGGAIFNDGTFYMYGGVISGNEALRGGAIYSSETMYLIAGTISDNSSTVYGGAISTSSTSEADSFLGSKDGESKLVIKNNRSLRAGGAIYSNTCSPILIEGNTEFINNHSETSGGAIYTAGPLLINDTLFDGNSCPGSGGAIYHHYTNPNYDRRFFEMSASTFTNNSGNIGGAIVFSASDAVADTNMGTYATITDCTFSKNNSISNGGAMYITRKGDVTIDKSTFSENTAGLSGGAVSMHSQSNVIVNDSEITNNTASAGGGINIASGTVATLKNIEFSNNSAKRTESGANGNGGALYVFDSGVLNVDNVDFYANSAENHAGAIYLGVTELTIDETCEFDGNTAGEHGGAMYMTYKTVKETDDNGEEISVKYGAKLNATNVTFKNNSAKSGGAISARTATEVNLTSSILTGNAAASTKNEEGGGAIYANNNKITLSGTQLVNNSSAYYGGAITALQAEVTIKDKSEIKENKGKTGSALNFRGKGAYNLTDIEVTNNGTGEGSGVLYATGGATFNLSQVTATGNNAYSGGVVYASSSTTVVNIDSCTFTENTAKSSGGAVCFKDATVNVTNCQVSKNTSNLGGAFYSEKGTLTVKNTAFTENSATSNGGAIDLVATVADVSENTTFTNNSAAGHGGAVYLNYIKKVDATDTTPEIPAVYSVLTVDGGKFEGNNAIGGGAVSVRTGSEAIFNGTAFDGNTVTGYQLVDSGNKPGKSDGDGEGGGAIYVGFGTIRLNNVTATGNEAIASEYVNDKQETKLYGFGGFLDGYQAAVYIDGSDISNNKAPSGGAINLVGSKNVLSINKTSFVNNESTYINTVDYDNTKGGGAINASGATVTINESDFDGNATNWYGGAAILSNSDVTIDKSTFTNSKGATGAALNIKVNSDVTINDTEFVNNNSTYNGVVYANNSTVTMNSVTASGNKAVNGGLLYVSNGNTVVNMNSCTFSGNTATSGGVAYTENATLKFNECEIKGNSATGNGGVVFSKTGAAKIEFNSCVDVSKNSAKSGGVVYTEPGASVKTNNTAFTENTATGSGGVLYVKEATEVKVDTSSFTKNYSKSNGGAIYVNQTPMTLIGSTFTENSTDSNGGAISIYGAVVTATGNNTFTSNSAVKHAGAIYVSYFDTEETETTPTQRIGGVLDITAGAFDKNTALGGGAVSVRTGSEAIFNGTAFDGNTVTGYQLVDSGNKPGKSDGDGEGGGAIYVGFGTIRLNNVTATGNEAIASEYVNDKQETKLYGFGGFLDGYQAAVYIDGSDISNNKAPSGGAINLVGSKNVLSINKTSFVNNESTYINTVDYDNTKGGGAINASGATVTINESDFDGNATNWYGGAAILSNSDVTIDKSTFTNSKGATGAALNIKVNSDVTINDTEFVNNNSTYNGVVYANNSTVTMNSVTASGNKAVNGGLLYVSNGNTVVNMNSCTFSGNTATSGGVAYTENATLKFNECEIKGNSATGNGGVVFSKTGAAKIEFNSCVDVSKNSAKSGGVVYTEPGASVKTNNTAFTENTATGSGGVLYVKEATEVKVDTSSFTKNYSKSNGGAIYVNQTPMTLIGSTFTENSTDSNGGAISIYGAVVTATGNNTFTSNSAVKHAGAIYVSYFDTEETETTPTQRIGGVLDITAGAFDKNTALGGGAISIRSSSEATLTDTVLTDNTVQGYTDVNDGDGECGGAIYVGYGELTLNNVTATGNESIATSYVNADGKEKLYSFGGVVDAYNGKVSIVGGIYSGNKAATGGAVYAKKSTVTVSGAEFKNNESTYVNSDYDSTCGGGAITVSGGTLDIAGSTLDGNKSDYYGGAVHATGATVNISNNSVFKNNTGKTGGAVYSSSGSKLTVDQSSFTANTSLGFNGIIYVSGTLNMTKVTATENNSANGVLNVGSGTATVSESNFSNNTATNQGGAIVAKNCKLTLEDNIFSGNSANQGGALYVYEATELTVDASTFTENYSKSNGGAIFVYRTPVTLIGSTFTGNSSDAHGGAISNAGAVITATGDNIFTSNTSKNHAGAIYVSYISAKEATEKEPAVEAAVGVLNMTGGTFENNSAAKAGGAISARTGSVVNLTSTVLKGNSASSENNSEGGGAIFANDGTLTLSGVVMDGNESAAYGGAITGLNMSLSISGNSEIKNCVGKTGTAFNFRGTGTYELTDITVKDNGSGDGNGVIYITGSGTLNLTRVTVSGNNVYNGGAIYNSGSTVVNVTDSTFSNNTVEYDGGAIFTNSSGAFAIKNTTFSANKATHNGGAIFARGTGVVTVTNCSFVSNTAASAGAICLDRGAIVNVVGGTFDSNSATSSDGGAIVVSDTSENDTKEDTSDVGLAATTLNISGATFTENTASKKGGAISTDTGSPNLVIELTSCIFSKNKAITAGGGAIEIQHGNQPNATDPQKVGVVMTNCEFVGNTSKTTGAAVEIRTSSTAKIDGITAKENSAGGNGGVVYVTSNFSRLYLTGTVTLNSNTATGGSFAYLYNSKYSNPPAIYTTHSDTADWVAAVGKSSANNIVFDLVTLP